MTVAGAGRADFRRGLGWGLVVGLVLAVPTGAALKAAGYPSEELYVWWVVLGAVLVVVWAVAARIAVRRAALAGGLAAGATISTALVPVLVVFDILHRSA